jgi:hypothetical protein
VFACEVKVRVLGLFSESTITVRAHHIHSLDATVGTFLLSGDPEVIPTRNCHQGTRSLSRSSPTPIATTLDHAERGDPEL